MIDFILLLICIIGSGFSSGSETALVSASRTRIQHLASKGQKSASSALEIIKQKEKILAVTLVVTNIFNISGGAIATMILTRSIGTFGPIIATIIMTSVLLVLSEIVPKTYFFHYSNKILIKTSKFWKYVSLIFIPITYPVVLLKKIMHRILKSPDKSDYSVTRDEIKLIIKESAEGGTIWKQQHEMLESALNYIQKKAREVMLPISEVALIPEVSTVEEFLSVVREQGHTRIPVYRERVDRIIGLVNVFDIFFDKHKKKHIHSYTRKAKLVPETKRVNQLFIEMQKEYESLAIVVNEFGACIGIITIEDIIEEIFGELVDEHEEPTFDIQKKETGRYIVDGRTDIDNLKQKTGISIKKRGFETVGGYVLYKLGRIPQKDETFTDANLKVKILEADLYRVKSIELQKKE
ncbi:MAG: hemolysin family protein [Petrotogales bacterium]